MSLEIILSLFEDIKESIEKIKRRFKSIKSPDDFLKNDSGSTNLDAIVMRLQVIGESLKKIDALDSGFLQKYPEIDWAKVKKMRDFISHHYNELDEIKVYTACKFDIPDLEKMVNRIIKDINDLGVV
ncbi:MAG TPA: DUF86 domain-containing protein [Ignavibacteriaceae bacterium]